MDPVELQVETPCDRRDAETVRAAELCRQLESVAHQLLMLRDQLGGDRSSNLPTYVPVDEMLLTVQDLARRTDFKKFAGGLSGVDLSGRPLTRRSNTPGTHPTGEPFVDKSLESERAGFEPAVRFPAHWFSKPAP